MDNPTFTDFTNNGRVVLNIGIEFKVLHVEETPSLVAHDSYMRGANFDNPKNESIQKASRKTVSITLISAFVYIGSHIARKDVRR